MKYQSCLLILLSVMSYSFSLSGQSLASANNSSEYQINKKTSSVFIGPNPDGFRDESIASDRLSTYESAIETYLNELILGTDESESGLAVPAEFEYVNEHLFKLKEVYGDDPYFYDRYYHPETQYLTGCHMGRAGMPIIEKVVFADGRIMANLVCRTEGAEIFYTTDGSIPNKNSKRFEQPLELTATKTICAKAIRTDLEHSPVLVFDKHVTYKKEAGERLNEDKIMGIYPVPDSDQVLIKFKTKNAGAITISLIDMNRKVHRMEIIQVDQPQYGRYVLNSSNLPSGSYLIKFKFESGKSTYRQVTR
jgi:hypothetical protein